MIGEELDKYIQNRVKEVLDNSKFPEYDDIHSDSFSELIDKLIIVHIRLWYLEDVMSVEKDADKMMLLKKKADITFKEKRPMLVRSIDKIINTDKSEIININAPITSSMKVQTPVVKA